MIKQLIMSLEDPDYTNKARQISDLLKPEVQTQNGLVRIIKNKTDNQRKSKLEQLITNFCLNHSDLLLDIDEDLNVLCSQMFKVNQEAIDTLPFDYLSLFAEFTHLQTNYPNFDEVYRAISDETNNSNKVRWRLIAIVSNLVSVSLGQGNKAQAGLAGEDLVKAVLGCIGMQEGNHYRSQWKGGTGSDTDFVIPYAKDFDMSKIKVFVAAQFSSNDRARMASSELHQGAERYLVTGNGMDVSSKSMVDIGVEIIDDYKRDNTKIVCRKSHVDEVIKQLKEKPGQNDERDKKIDYFQKYHLSFSDFAKELRKKLFEEHPELKP